MYVNGTTNANSIRGIGTKLKSFRGPFCKRPDCVLLDKKMQLNLFDNNYIFQTTNNL